jgi:hypothetical protein
VVGRGRGASPRPRANWGSTNDEVMMNRSFHQSPDNKKSRFRSFPKAAACVWWLS